MTTFEKGVCSVFLDISFSFACYTQFEVKETKNISLLRTTSIRQYQLFLHILTAHAICVAMSCHIQYSTKVEEVSSCAPHVRAEAQMQANIASTQLRLEITFFNGQRP